MSNEFHVGQKVVCIFKGPWPSPNDECKGSPSPKFNHIYTVTELEWRSGRCGLVLAELREDECHHSIRFRPLESRETDISIFKAMLEPSKEPQAEVS